VVTSLRARSISHTVWATLTEQSFTGHVLAVFERACNLKTPDGKVMALVLPKVGDGPLNVVVDASPGDLARMEPGMAARSIEQRLWVGELEITLDGAEIWDPCPDWNTLRAQCANREDRFRRLQALARRQESQGSLLGPVVQGAPAPRPASTISGKAEEATFQTTWQATEALRAGLEGDKGRLHRGVTQLAGLGKGLTPAGDDFLNGVMLWAWLAHPTPHRLCQQIVELAVPRTTNLSAGFLRAAANGECNAPWHHLLSALASGPESHLESALQQVLAHGATSGADTLAGFLWMERE
jgi:hypothetical protein